MRYFFCIGETELGQLVELQVLDLGRSSPSLDPSTGLNSTIPAGLNNTISTELNGTIPTGLNGTIPTELGRLVNLTHLDLSGNILEGPIPEDLFNMSNLKSLD